MLEDSIRENKLSVAALEVVVSDNLTTLSTSGGKRKSKLHVSFEV